MSIDYLAVIFTNHHEVLRTALGTVAVQLAVFRRSSGGKNPNLRELCSPQRFAALSQTQIRNILPVCLCLHCLARSVLLTFPPLHAGWCLPLISTE